MRRHNFATVLVATIFLFLTGCHKDSGTAGCLSGNTSCADQVIIQDSTTNGGSGTTTQSTSASALSCTSTPDRSVVLSGDYVGVTTNCSGGTAPYVISRDQHSYAGVNFSPAMTLHGIYYNYGNTDNTLDKAIRVTDAKGNSVIATFRVTVRSWYSVLYGNRLGCQLVPSTNSPTQGQTVTFQMYGFGGTTSDYTFYNFYPEPSVRRDDSTITKVNAYQSTSSYVYPAATQTNANVMVRTSSNESAICYANPFTVQTVDLLLTAEPSVRVAVDQTMTVRVVPIRYPTGVTPTITYSSSDASVNVTNSGLYATLTNPNRAEKTFTLTITATASGFNTVTKTMTLYFGGTTNPSLQCSLTPSATQLFRGTFYTFTVANTANANDPMEIRDFSPGGGEGTILGLSGSASYSHNFANSTVLGPRTVSVRARSRATGHWCFAGYSVNTSVELRGRLNQYACSLTGNPGTAILGSNVRAQASTLPYVGKLPMSMDIINVPANVDTLSSVPRPGGNNMVKLIRLLSVGNYSITARVTDANGDTADCSSTLYATKSRNYVVSNGTSSELKAYLYDNGVNYQDGSSFYAPSGISGQRIARADVNGDGVTDIIIGDGAGGSNRVVVFNGVDHATKLYDFTAFSGGNGGVFVAGGDIDGDGLADVVVGQDGAASVKVYSSDAAYPTPRLLLNFTPYNSSFAGGIRVAVGDKNGDGFSEVATVPGAGDCALIQHASGYGCSRVKIFNGADFRVGSANLINEFYAFYGSISGTNIAMGDVIGDSSNSYARDKKADIIAVEDRYISGTFYYSARVFHGSRTQSLYPYDYTSISYPFSTSTILQKGMRVAVADLDGDGNAEILFGTGPNTTTTVKVYKRVSSYFSAFGLEFQPFGSSHTGGLWLGAGAGSLY